MVSNKQTNNNNISYKQLVIGFVLGYFLAVNLHCNMRSFHSAFQFNSNDNNQEATEKSSTAVNVPTNNNNTLYRQQEEQYQQAKIIMQDLVPQLRNRELKDHKQHNDRINSLQNPEICVKREWHLDKPWAWFIYKPIWNCNLRERIGEIFDGGKFLCNIDYLKSLTTKQKQPCLVYSLGSAGLVDFENELRERTECDIHIFDPTVSDERIPVLPKGIEFHQVGISDKTGTITLRDKEFPVKSLQEIMADLGHDHINVLKMDIDGSEYETIPKLGDILATKVDELLIEIHWKGLELTIKMMETILDAGFRPFSCEPNLFYYTLPASGIEYSFIHDRVAEQYNR